MSKPINSNAAKLTSAEKNSACQTLGATKTNELKLIWEPQGVHTELGPSCTIYVDGVSLPEKLSEFIQIRSYGPIEVPSNPHSYFSGTREAMDEIAGKKPVAWCLCGYGCSNVIACTIEQKDGLVIWRDFESRRGEDLSQFNTFVFDELQYFNEVHSIRQSF